MSMFLSDANIYNIPNSEVEAIIHKETKEVKMLFILYMDVAFQSELKEMLDKICAALKMSQEDVEYLIVKQDIDLSDFLNKYSANKVVCFGAEPRNLNIQAQLQLYKNYTLGDTRILMANDIIDIYPNQNLKSKLWKSLQEL